ncbi:Cysteine synthase 2 [Boothiomyces sp. JEL0838]|nr:Cysteine synthase 2 [Boothiomyces sp. JEL0838]
MVSATIAGLALSIYYLTRRKDVPKGIEQLIGNTPLIKINSLSRATGCTILAKAEFMNVGGSSKDRVALAVIEDAERKGLIKPNTGSTIFEGTVGSTGISLAIISRAKGYKCHIVMPDDVAQEKSNLLLMLGATVEKVKPCSIVDPNHFVNLARKRAEEMNSSNSDAHGLFCNQFENLVNFDIHYRTTGPEIYKQTGGKIDAFVMGAGTGGTIGGVSAYLKSKLKNIKVILADPQGSGLYNKIRYNLMYTSHEAEGTRKRHQIDTIVEGVGINRLTANFAKAIEYIDDAVKVTDEEAVGMSRYLVNNDGLFVGSSSSVNCVAAVKLARKLGPGHTIVTLLCDSGSRHLTKFWSDEFLQKVGIEAPAEGLDFIKQAVPVDTSV